MGETMQGRRVPDGDDLLRDGDYGRVLVNGRWVWFGRAPSSHGCNLDNHEVTEHEDGTITVSPSILLSTTVRGDPVELWHGWLERGVWRSATRGGG